MMKRLFLTIIIPFVSICCIHAALIPSYDTVENRQFFDSPALLGSEQWSSPFAFELSAGSDFEGLNFLANPAKALDGPAEKLAQILMKKDLDYWNSNAAMVSVLESFDESFPDEFTSDYDLFNVRQYFHDVFLSDRYGDDRRAYVVAQALRIDPSLFSSSGEADIIGGDTRLAVNLYGGSVRNSFGWDWNVNVVFDGASSIVNSAGSRFAADVRFNIGYAFTPGEKLSIGFALQPMLRAETSVPNANYLSARLSDDMLALFTEDFLFGTGIALNLGIGYEVNSELYLTLDLRNAPSFRSYYSIGLTDLAQFNLDFTEDDDIYYIPMDVALTAYWNRASHHLQVELSDIVSQLFWTRLEDDLNFNYYSLLKLEYTYDISDDLSIGAGYRYREISFMLSYKGLHAEFSAKLDRISPSIVIGYEF